MAQPYHPEDRPDPNENMPAMRARVPEHVSRGVFSTGAIVMTGSTEFILDFVQNLGRPHQVVARIVLPHVVMPQFADALSTNIELYRQRFGPLPNSNPTPPAPPHAVSGNNPAPGASESMATPNQPTGDPLSGLTQSSQIVGGFSPPTAEPSSSSPSNSALGSAPAIPPSASGNPIDGSNRSPVEPNEFTSQPSTPGPSTSGQNIQPAQTPPPRKPTAQEVYDELKLRDETLSGAYANAVMIGHGPHEFSFDFITNFYPQSAVSSRVFLAAGQVARLLDSLRTAWEQLRPRLYPPQNPPPSA